MRHLLLTALIFASFTTAHVFAAPIDDAENAYFNGDYAGALKIIQPLAEKGDARALNRLGSMYQMGRGVEKDPKKGIELYLKSAAKGNAEAYNNMGISYLAGEGVEYDMAKALSWFEKGAAKGYSYSHFNLGSIYGDGLGGTPRNPMKAYIHMLLAKAEEDGMKDGKKNSDFITDKPNPDAEAYAAKSNFTAAQLADGKARAKACFVSNFKKCAY